PPAGHQETYPAAARDRPGSRSTLWVLLGSIPLRASVSFQNLTGAGVLLWFLEVVPHITDAHESTSTKEGIGAMTGRGSRKNRLTADPPGCCNEVGPWPSELAGPLAPSSGLPSSSWP